MFPSVNFHKIPLDYKLENANRNVLIDTLVIIKMGSNKGDSTILERLQG